MTKEKILCLMGPTASGKTDLAIALADYFPIEIISVDSAMVYRGMDIGTAKPDIKIRKKIPHYLIDICDPSEIYSAGQFCRDVIKLIREIIARKHLPILVGGTMLYFRALQQGLAALPQADADIRKRLNAQAEKTSWQELHQYLAKIDPNSAARIKPQDAQRIQRAIEVYEITGKSLSDWHAQNQGFLNDYQIINIGVAPSNRDILRERIAQRFHAMITAGLIEEVQKLHQRKDLNADLPSLRSVGYRQIWDYLEGKLSYDDMIKRAIIASQQLAKRQLTWLRTWPDLKWFNSDSPDLINAIVSFLKPLLHPSLYIE